MINKAKLQNYPNTYLILANNENLPYDDMFCDRYIANLSLQIVENPVNMINESFRVLQHGGIAVFSVLGKQNPTNLIYFTENLCIKAGMASAARSMFYLSSDEFLRKLIKDAGFHKVLTFYSSSPFNISNIEEAMILVNDAPTVQQAKSQSEEIYTRAIASIREYLENLFSSGSLITFDALIAVAYKE